MSVEEEESKKERTKVSVNNGQVNAWTNNGQLHFQTPLPPGPITKTIGEKKTRRTYGCDSYQGLTVC